mmetsp:Transcript_113862/g.197875  ORF Transcript_113862/g.197875 Transcript_113862/m.197875 type:complete len:229 (-) Transcript_113862:1138-1824(-)
MPLPTAPFRSATLSSQPEARHTSDPCLQCWWNAAAGPPAAEPAHPGTPSALPGPRSFLFPGLPLGSQAAAPVTAAGPSHLPSAQALLPAAPCPPLDQHAFAAAVPLPLAAHQALPAASAPPLATSPFPAPAKCFVAGCQILWHAAPTSSPVRYSTVSRGRPSRAARRWSAAGSAPFSLGRAATLPQGTPARSSASQPESAAGAGHHEVLESPPAGCAAHPKPHFDLAR